MSADREMLKLAAKAAGFDGVTWSDHFGWMALESEGAVQWNPLTDDRDALRLVVKLNIHITSSTTDAWASTLGVTATEPMGKYPYVATRRAIVRAAAEIGKAMP